MCTVNSMCEEYEVHFIIAYCHLCMCQFLSYSLHYKKVNTVVIVSE